MQSLWMLVAAFLFSIMAACVKAASVFHSSSEIAFVRGLTGVVVMLAVAMASRADLRTQYLGLHAKRSLTGVTALLFWFYAIGKIPLATAMTMNYMSPIWLAALSFFGGITFLNKNNANNNKNNINPASPSTSPHPISFSLINKPLWLTFCILASFSGVLLLLKPSHLSQDLTKVDTLAVILGLSSGVLAAIAYRSIAELGQKGEPEIRIVFYFSMISACVSGLTIPFFPRHELTAHGLILMIAAGTAATFAQLALTRAFALGKTLLSANLSYTGIIFSAIWGFFIWHEPVDIWGILGISLIVASSVFSTWLMQYKK